jgi:hypothetical protein
VLAGLVTRYNAGRLTWSVEYDDEASQAPEELGAADMVNRLDTALHITVLHHGLYFGAIPIWWGLARLSGRAS